MISIEGTGTYNSSLRGGSSDEESNSNSSYLRTTSKPNTPDSSGRSTPNQEDAAINSKYGNSPRSFNPMEGCYFFPLFFEKIKMLESASSLPLDKKTSFIVKQVNGVQNNNQKESWEKVASEDIVSTVFEQIKSKENFLQQFIANFPKGGDTHSHLTGAIEARTYLQYAIEKGLYYDEKTFTFYRFDEIQKIKEKTFYPAENISFNYDIQKKYFEKASTRGKSNEQPLSNEFFETFPVFESIEKFLTLSELLTPLIKSADDQKILYLEVSKGFEFDLELLNELKDPYLTQFPTTEDFKKNKNLEEILDTKLALISPKLKEKMEKYLFYIDQAEKIPPSLKKRGFNKKSLFSIENPVVVRINVDVSRELTLPAFFADLALATYLVKEESQKETPRVLGIVISGREHHLIALQDRRAHHQLLSYFRKKFPEIKVSLHVGELTEDIVEQKKINNVIRKAIERALPDRIGHAVCLSYDKNMFELMNKLKAKKICVETCLTSNEKILQIFNGKHPIVTYLLDKVPLTLNTDDAGVNGTTLTGEFLKAIQRYPLSYKVLKKLARDQIRFSFLKGNEIYQENSVELLPCFKEIKEGELSQEAKDILNSSPKALLQYKLENSFLQFEEWVRNILNPHINRSTSEKIEQLNGLI